MHCEFELRKLAMLNIPAVLQVHADAQEVSGACCLASLATHAVLYSRRGCHLLCRVHSGWHHFEDIGGACTHAQGATDAGVIDLDSMGASCHHAGALVQARGHASSGTQSNPSCGHASHTAQGLGLVDSG